MKTNKEDCEDWSVVMCKNCNFGRGSAECKKYTSDKISVYMSTRWCGRIKKK